MTRRMYKVSLAALAAGLLIAPAAHAQSAPISEENGESDNAAVDAGSHVIVVVGRLTDVVVGQEDIEFRQANDLADIFRQTPSVTVGGSLGIAQKIYVRGLEDSQLNVTIDGAPQHGTLFHHIGRVSIEPELLETVELQAGAGEATAGFGAIGGAIRFRTRDATDLLAPGRDVGAMGKAGWFSNDGYKLSATLYGRLVGDVGVVGSYVYSDRDTFQDGDGNEVLGTAATQQLGFVKIGGDVGAGHRFTVSYEHRDEEGEFGPRPNWPVFAGDPLFPADAKRQTVIGNYGFDSGGGLGFEGTAYWTRATFQVDRFDRWGLYGAAIETWGGDARILTDVGDHAITAGVDYRNDQVLGRYLEDPAVWADWAWDPDIRQFEERGELIGIYLQDHWRPLAPLLVSFGVRYDAYDLDLVTYGGGTSSDGFSFNLGADLEVLPGLTLNAGYGEAFRGKEIGDGFTLEHRPGRDILQPGLRPERADNFEAGVSYAANGFNLSAAYFDMTIEDVVLDQLYSGAPPQDSIYYENVGDFSSNGFELQAGYRSGPFGVRAFYTSYDSRLNGRRIEGYEHIALGNTMGDNWSLSASYDPLNSLGLEASLSRYEAVEDLEVLFRDAELGFLPGTLFIDKPGYTVVDLFARWQPLGNDSVTLLAAVYNLFDKQYLAHASVADYTAIPDYELVSGLREPGRNVRLTVSFRY
ncbi:MAG TPA: TonB-dependent receptor [Croceibacterium sp.]|nr:TonB-dependent receptor [Croceibacterium sp.]